MIKITTLVIENIIQHAKKDAPIEACGYMAGSENIISKSYPMVNIYSSPEHFSFDEVEQFKVMRLVRDEKLDIMANYHSHPVTPARPSKEDIKLAYDPNILYFIVSLANGKESIKAFRIINSEVEEIEIEIL